MPDRDTAAEERAARYYGFFGRFWPKDAHNLPPGEAARRCRENLLAWMVDLYDKAALRARWRARRNGGSSP